MTTSEQLLVRQERDLTWVSSTLTMKSGFPRKLKLYASWVAYLAGMWKQDDYLKEGLNYKGEDWTKLVCTQMDPLPWLFTNYSPHYNTKNHEHG